MKKTIIVFIILIVLNTIALLILNNQNNSDNIIVTSYRCILVNKDSDTNIVRKDVYLNKKGYIKKEVYYTKKESEYNFDNIDYGNLSISEHKYAYRDKRMNMEKYTSINTDYECISNTYKKVN